MIFIMIILIILFIVCEVDDGRTAIGHLHAQQVKNILGGQHDDCQNTMIIDNDIGNGDEGNDVSMLEARGCLRMMMRLLRDELVQQALSNPTPMIDENDAKEFKENLKVGETQQ